MNHYFTHFDSLFKSLSDEAWDYHGAKPEVPAKERAEVCSMPDFPHSNVWMSEDTNSLTLEFALAGYNKEDIAVTANAGVIRVSVDPERDDKEVISVHHGISRRKVNFSLNIDKVFDAKSAKTSFYNGILSLHMKKNEDEEAVKLM